jgi:hypothetical protein
MPNITQDVRDSSSPVWDMSQERQLAVNVTNQRFQFFLLFFSLTVGGAFNSRTQIHMSIIFCLGAFISTLLFWVVYRSQQRLNRIFDVLLEDETHPATIIAKKSTYKHRIQPVISYVIASICCIILVIGAIASSCGFLEVANRG